MRRISKALYGTYRLTLKMVSNPTFQFNLWEKQRFFAAEKLSYFHHYDIKSTETLTCRLPSSPDMLSLN